MILLDLTLGQAIVAFVIGTLLIMGISVVIAVLLANRKAYKLIKEVPPKDVELIDVLCHTSNDTNNINSHSFKYVVRNLADNKIYLIDECNLHAELETNTITNDSFKVCINVFSTDKKIDACNDNVVSIGVKGKMYAKKCDEFIEINYGKWVIHKLKNTHFDGKRICSVIGEDYKAKENDNAELWYSFNERVPFEKLRNMEYAHGYTEFEIKNRE